MKHFTPQAICRAALAGSFLFTVGAVGCASTKDEGPASNETDDEGLEGHGDDAGQGGQTPPVTPPISETEEVLAPLPGNETGEADGGAQSCASTSANGELQELALAFAFDVSGSMGIGDFPYHNKELKWDPVVAATKAFFESPDVARVSASMVFFPTAEEDNRCDTEEYATPDIPLQALPSMEFSDALDDLYPDRGGTPTLAVVQATIRYVDSLIEAGSTAKHAIVLVTDGTPAGCTEEFDSVDLVADAVAEVSDRIPVYVIGIANPPTDEEPNPPDNVSGLHQIAQAGSAADAFLIDTGNPTQTVADFNVAIQTIRESGISCELAIPDAPSGQTFDKEKVNVSLTADTEVSELIYSEDCSEDDAWRYDDAEQPSRIVLCEQTCEVIKSHADAALRVEFGCERRVSSVK